MRVRLIKDFSLPLRQPAKSQAAPELLMPLDLDDSFAFHQLCAWLCSSARLGWDEERSVGRSCLHLPRAFRGLHRDSTSGVVVLRGAGLRGSGADVIKPGASAPPAGDGTGWGLVLVGPPAGEAGGESGACPPAPWLALLGELLCHSVSVAEKPKGTTPSAMATACLVIEATKHHKTEMQS